MYDVYGRFVIVGKDINDYVEDHGINQIEVKSIYPIINSIIYEHLFNLFLNQKEERKAYER